MANSFGKVKTEPQPVFGGQLLGGQEAAALRFVEESARVVRWHTESVTRAQTVGEHTYMVVHLVHALTDGAASRNLLLAALYHDTAERKFGDVPGPTKRQANLSATFSEMEDEYMELLKLPVIDLTEADARVLKLADLLEGALYCAFELRRGNRDIRAAFRNYLNYTREMLTVDAPLGVRIYTELLEFYNDEFQR